MKCTPRIAKSIPNGKPPCYGCDKRSVGCHSNCEEYKTWKAKRIETWREIKKVIATESECEEYTVRAIQKNKKKKTPIR